MTGHASAELFARAQRVIPGGVNSPVRAFRAVGGSPYFVTSASGATITDADGHVYLDYVQSWGASILGHANPAIVAAVQEAAARGTTFGAPTEHEVLLAEEIAAAVPGAAMVRLVSSGTEAAMTAIRLARGATGRDRIVKFAGGYHGHSDALLAAGGSGVATLGLPDSAGVPAAAVADTTVAPYNTVPSLKEDVACVIVEPVAANMGVVVPEPGFLEGLADACHRVGALLIFDEVITGFRLARGGASAVFGVEPDLFGFGKVIGGGLPLAAIAGRPELMSQLAPLGPVYQAGTLSGNPLATAAGLAALAQLDEAAYVELESKVVTLAEGLAAAFGDAGVPVQLPRARTLLGCYFDGSPVRTYDDARRANATEAYRIFFHAMLDEGVAFAPSGYEAIFTSLAHREEDLERTIEAARIAARAVAGGMKRR